MFISVALETSGVMNSVTSDDGKLTQPDDLAPKDDTVTVRNALEPCAVATKFWDTTIQLMEMLRSFDPKLLISSFDSLRASEQANIPLFPAYYMEHIKGSKSTPALVQKLAPYTNWMDHSILNAAADASNVPEAAALLNQYDSRIDTSQPVTKYPIPSPSHHMMPYDTSTHTVLAVQLNMQLHQSTLQNIIDTRSLIQEKCEVTPHCLQLLAVAKTSNTIIYWTIPKHVASVIASNIQQHKTYLHQNGLQHVAIYPGTFIVTGSALTVGPFSFFAKVSSLIVL